MSHRYQFGSDPAARAGPASTTLDPPEDLHVLPFRIGSDEYVFLTFRVDHQDTLADVVPRLALLTQAERSIVTAVLRGQSNASIAGERGTSARTIGNQLTTIYRKLGVTSRRELGAYMGPRDK
jgi:DNA-binding CsgD family transcriptional regulator